MDTNEIWFILLQLSNDKKIKLIRKYSNEENIRKNSSIIKELKGANINEVTEEKIKKFQEYINKNNIGYITINSKEYPENLNHLSDPPYVIFYKGNLELLKGELIAVIGARKYSGYGAQVTKVISKELSENNFTVVSGLAAGIDSIAQRSAIDYPGKTIGVLGCGIDIIYPKSNKLLYEDILKNHGLIISEFLPNTPPMAYNFPRRNRIISGISKKLIIIEATDKSGSLITVNYALELGMDVMAVPGPVFNGNSEGCNKLIRDGAKPFTEMVDLYDFLSIIKEKNKNREKNTCKSIILNIINSEPIHLDDIIESVNVDRKVLFELLFEMQNRNEIICLPGNYYAKSI
ncbi:MULTISPECIES: DNA-processing protein DprA [unclassified Clostridium]|uniref:DNA-processing protein DprA n=1 Tax=unclassified Clostridium TaxID=2614128 RepID=UPI002910C045|nr:DNA-processing protein DprA [Clostridium sp.]MDU5107817.1 DNA-processing protein DprA [Clostridium sp.]